MKSKDEEEPPPLIQSDLPVGVGDPRPCVMPEYPETLARLLAAAGARTPMCVGVTGPWGSGKTTVLRQAKRMLDEIEFAKRGDKVTFPKPARDAVSWTTAYATSREIEDGLFRPCRTVWFDAWKYADEDELLMALIRVILNTMARSSFGDKLWSKYLDPVEGKRLLRFLSMFKFKYGDVELGVDFDAAYPENAFTSKTAFFDLFDEVFERLLARWVHGGRKLDRIDDRDGALVVFIDDLDRCLPDKTVQVLEAIKLFLDKPGCLFVLGADKEVVGEAVVTHYEGAGFNPERATHYLEKIVQVTFNLPRMQCEALGRIVDVSDTGQELEDLSEVVQYNPRNLKTLVNDINLNWKILRRSSGTELESIERGDFTAWSVVWRFAPETFRREILQTMSRAPDQRHAYLLEARKWARGGETDADFSDCDPRSEFARALREMDFSESFTAESLDAFIKLQVPARQEEEAAPDVGGVKRAEIDQITVGGMEFIRVPAGGFVFQDGKQATLDHDYHIGRFPVTVAQWREFRPDKEGEDDHPVVLVSWVECRKFFEWFNGRHGDSMPEGCTATFPTEREWEKAARGRFGNKWPWGNEYEKGRCNDTNAGIDGTSAVGKFSPHGGDSPYGVADMAGNVWEWTRTGFDGEDRDSADDDVILKGGCFLNDEDRVVCAARLRYRPLGRDHNVGVRCVLSPFPL